MSRYLRLLISSLTLLASLGGILYSVPAQAQSEHSVAVMGFRSTDELPVEIVQDLNSVLWRKVSEIPDIIPVAEPHLAQFLGTAYRTMALCADDPCMEDVMNTAGTTSVIWGFINRDLQQRYLLSVRIIVRNGEVDWVDTTSRGDNPSQLISSLRGLDVESLVDFAQASIESEEHLPAAPIPQQPSRRAPGAPVPVSPTPVAAPQPAKGFISLSTSPEGAEVYHDNRSLGTTPLTRYQMEPGSYRLRIEKPSYQTIETTMDVESFGHVSKEFIMVSTMGELDVTTSPANATITLAGDVIGESPINGLMLPAGSYMVEAEKEGHDSARQQVIIQPGQQSSVALKLNPVVARLSVTSTPAGAAVLLDNREVGETPIRDLSLSPGMRQVTVRLKGYEDHTETVSLRAGAGSQVWARLARELPPEGTVTIESTPSGAEVALDGRRLGRTPIRNRQMNHGVHTLQFKLEGYDPLDHQLVVERGGQHQVNVELQEEPMPAGKGMISLTTEPARTTRTLGGMTFRPNQPITDYLIDAGTYQVEVRAPGHESEEFLIRVEEGQHVEINRTLSRAQRRVATGFLTVNSDPPGAMVVMGDDVLGTTPLERAEVPVGQQRISVHKQDYQAVERRVNIVRGQVRRVSVQLDSTSPSLRVTTNPPGATVLLSGQRLGETPNTFSQLREGTFPVIISLVGHREATEQVTLRNGVVTELHVDLDVTPGYLTIRTRPQEAVILIDGRYAGQSPLNRHELPPGEHQIEVRAPGHLPASGRVTIESRKTHTLDFNLEPE